MWTLLFIFLMFGVFGKLIGLAFRATWGITKIFFRLIYSSGSPDRTCAGWPDVHSSAVACNHWNCSVGAGVIT